MSEIQERRRDLRVKVTMPLKVKFRVEKKFLKLSPQKTGRVEDISVGGMFIELPVLKRDQLKRIMEGKERLIIEFQTPKSKKPIRVVAKVVRVGKRLKGHHTTYAAGLYYEDIGLGDREKILQYLVRMCLKGDCCIA